MRGGGGRHQLKKQAPKTTLMSFSYDVRQFLTHGDNAGLGVVGGKDGGGGSRNEIPDRLWKMYLLTMRATTGLPAVQVSAAGSPSRMARSPKHCPFFSSVLLRLPIRRDDDSTIPAVITVHMSCQHRHTRHKCASPNQRVCLWLRLGGQTTAESRSA